jgi:hypothetical protein
MFTNILTITTDYFPKYYSPAVFIRLLGEITFEKGIEFLRTILDKCQSSGG